MLLVLNFLIMWLLVVMLGVMRVVFVESVLPVSKIPMRIGVGVAAVGTSAALALGVPVACASDVESGDNAMATAPTVYSSPLVTASGLIKRDEAVLNPFTRSLYLLDAYPHEKSSSASSTVSSPVANSILAISNVESVAPQVTAAPPQASVTNNKKKEIVLQDVLSGSQDASAMSKSVDSGVLKTGNKLNLARERILTLKAYLDEAERDIMNKDWTAVKAYLYTFADQEASFADLIDGLFPAEDELDTVTREALSFEAQSIFLNLEELREAVSNRQDREAVKAYARLLLSYDHFLKAGDLYPTYDPITSTEVFYSGTNTPAASLRWDTSREPRLRDRVLFKRGPDMGKTGIVLDVDSDNMAIVKLDVDGKAYQEVKSVKLDLIGKTLAEDDDQAALRKGSKKPSGG